jgi:hypothetical protein
MPNLRNRFPARRRFLKQSAALTASASLAAPMLVVAQTQASDGAAPVPADDTPPRTDAATSPAPAAKPRPGR